MPVTTRRRVLAATGRTKAPFPTGEKKPSGDWID
jgi:hypothetical protein